MPNSDFFFFYSIGFFLMQGAIVAIATSALIYIAIAKIVNLFWPKPKESKDGLKSSKDDQAP